MNSMTVSPIRFKADAYGKINKTVNNHSTTAFRADSMAEYPACTDCIDCEEKAKPFKIATICLAATTILLGILSIKFHKNTKVAEGAKEEVEKKVGELEKNIDALKQQLADANKKPTFGQKIKNFWHKLFHKKEVPDSPAK